ncbi:hypothetical protein H0H93_011709 [Arthromyces matolae]|nr:hypothetical protein H0H93_011709 [Arthromyces matolae]
MYEEDYLDDYSENIEMFSSPSPPERVNPRISYHMTYEEKGDDIDYDFYDPTNVNVIPWQSQQLREPRNFGPVFPIRTFASDFVSG